MQIEVTTHPKAKRSELVEKEGCYHAYVKAAPEKGKANAEVIDLLSQRFRVPKKSIRLLRGETSRKKWFELG